MLTTTATKDNRTTSRSFKDSSDSLAVYVDSSLELGEVKRYKLCPFCGREISAKGFIVQRTERGWLLYCHKCKDCVHIDKSGLPLSKVKELLKLRQQVAPSEQNILRKVVTLPADFTSDIPEPGLFWLEQYGVTPQERQRFCIGYSESLNRVILPVFEGDELVYWQGRRLSADKVEPKYINVRASSRDGIYFKIRTANSDLTVIVEDILSAIAVARAGYSTLALLGSYANHSLRNHLTTERVKFWLDTDKRKESIKFSKTLRANGFTCSSVLLHTKDPKEYSTEEIKSTLEGG